MPGAIAGELEWRPLRSIDNGRLREARLQAHYAVQWLARVARGYIPPQLDDGHTSLNWVSALNGFMTQPLKNDTRLSLQVNNLTLALHESNAAAAVKLFSLNGRSNEQARQWLGEQFSRRNLDTRALDADSPYEIPAHAIAKGSVYDAAGSADALIELAAWFANAANLLGQIHKKIIERKLAASPVCCWPHHFDLATLTMLPKPATDETGYVGVGLSPGDRYYDEPYFYVSVYPKPDPSALPTLPMFGHWHTHEFMAAIVPAHKIVAEKNQKTETDEFLRCAVDAAIKILS
jgi:hypothetical protein